mgnify:CR=1 FL=1
MRISTEDKSGLYLTVILHLGVLIVLLIAQISSTLRGESSYLLDFSAIEEQEQEEQETEFKESVSERLDRLIAAASAAPMTGVSSHEEIRNIAVDAGNGHLQDDRNTDADQLYRDIERLDRELKSGAYAREIDHSGDYAALQESAGKESGDRQEVYTGPSVVSYSLDGRKAIHLSIPAYRCPGGGDVTVRITVSQSGTVEAADIVDELSSGDRCLREYAKRAARLSRFTASTSAPRKQFGDIVYRFIAQ